MPKDPARNIDRYQVEGKHLNEFEFQRNQGEMSREEQDRFARSEEERALREQEAEQAMEANAERSESLLTAARGESDEEPATESKAQKASGGK